MHSYLEACTSKFGLLALYWAFADSVCIAYDTCTLVFPRSLAILQFTSFHHIEDPT